MAVGEGTVADVFGVWAVQDTRSSRATGATQVK